ncbi:hypothetical protein PHISCL_04606, partial [Aspergillus sclerotialis]
MDNLDTNTIDPSATASPTPTTSVHSDSTVTVTHTHIHSSTATLTPTPSGAPANSKSSVNGAMIGGIAAGVVALAAIIAIIVCICRRQRKQGNSFALLPSNISRSRWRDRYDEKHVLKIKYPFSKSQRRNDRGQLEDTQTTSNRTTITNSSSYTGTSPGLTLNSLASSPDSGARFFPSDRHRNTPSSAIPFLPPIPPTVELLASTPAQGTEQATSHADNPTPELSDTGFYRQRAELATHSQSELINIPIDQRRNKDRASGIPVRVKGADTAQVWPRHEYVHGDDDEKKSSTALTDLSPSPPIITRDGAVLRSNFDDGGDESMSTPERDSRVRGRISCGEGRRHVMSFMQYDSWSGSDSPLRGSLGREDDE